MCWNVQTNGSKLLQFWALLRILTEILALKKRLAALLLYLELEENNERDANRISSPFFFTELLNVLSEKKMWVATTWMYQPGQGFSPHLVL